MDNFSVPSGFGFRRLLLEELQVRTDLIGCLQIFEHPRTRGARRYILGVDVADGVGKDRSAVAVHRMGTIEEPEEQVALYVSDQVTPVQLAYVIDAIGHLYTDDDRFEAMAVVECNNHGLSTQDTLQLHLSYHHFYRWEYLDAADPSKRYTTRVGWVTSNRTRPMLLDKLYESLTHVDPVTHATDLLVHAAILREELADFQTEGALWEAAASRGAHDDVVMATAIAHYVAWRLQGGEQEPLAERRARMHAEAAARDAAGAHLGPKRDWRNTGCTADEWKAGVALDEMDDSVYDDRHDPIFLP